MFSFEPNDPRSSAPTRRNLTSSRPLSEANNVAEGVAPHQGCSLAKKSPRRTAPNVLMSEGLARCGTNGGLPGEFVGGISCSIGQRAQVVGLVFVVLAPRNAG